MQICGWLVGALLIAGPPAVASCAEWQFSGSDGSQRARTSRSMVATLSSLTQIWTYEGAGALLGCGARATADS